MESGKRHRRRTSKIGERFAYLPWSVLNSAAYIGLSCAARSVLIELARQYTGDNNGDLTLAPSVMIKRGLPSRSNLARATAELEQARLIQKVRQGHRQRLCSLWAVTWRTYDYNPVKHEVGPRSFDRNGFMTVLGTSACPPMAIKAIKQAHRRTSRDAAMPTDGRVGVTSEEL
jgi:hypothetical protein